jgi:hypothetical protein
MRELLRDKWLWAGAVLLCVLTVAVWWTTQAPPASGAAPQATGGLAQLPLIKRNEAATNKTAQAYGPVPAGLQASEWQQLNESLQDHPQRAQEIARVVGYLQFSRSLAQFQTLREQSKSGDTPGQLRDLAAQLSTQLDDRLQHNELSGGEAMLIKTSLLEVLQPDAAQRNAALRTWQQEQEQQRLASRAAPPDAREAAFAREQAAIIAAWSAQPAHQRNEQQLEEQLEALRQRHF